MSGWIKVTPDTMPPDMEAVLVTARCRDKRSTMADVRWNGLLGLWEMLLEASDYYWAELWDCYEVTHWMPYPAPAQD